MGLEAATYIADLVTSNPTSDDGIAQADDHMRLIKSVLMATLGGLDGPLLNADGELASAEDLTALFVAVAALQGGANTGGWLIDEIKAYVGEVENIPAGWFICNGANGTKDMRGRMALGDNQNPPVGGPKYDSASQGGNLPGQMTTGPAGGHSHSVTVDPHTLTAAQIPGHDHPMFANTIQDTNDAGHVIAPGDNVARRANGHLDYSMAKSASAPTLGKTGSNNGAASAVAHTGGTTNAVAAHTHTLSGASLPPWGAVYWIQYKGVE